MERESMSKRQIWVLALLCGQLICGSAAYSIMATFFPTHGEAIGLSKFEIAICFASFAATFAVAGIVCGQLGPKIGIKNLILIGACIESASAIIFGFSNSFWQFLVLRLVQGFFAGMANTGVYAIPPLHMRKHMGKANSFLELFQGLGFLIGPPIGGILYTIGGFYLPFLSLNVFNYAVFFAVWYFLPKDRDSLENVEKSDVELGKKEVVDIKIYVSPSILLATIESTVTLTILIITTTVFGVIEVSLALHVQNSFGMGTMAITLVMLLLGVSYGTFSVVVGIIVDRTNRHKRIMKIGLTFSSLFCILLSASPPFPWIPLPFGNSTVALVWISFIMMTYGIFASMCIIPSIPFLMDLAKEAITKDTAKYIRDISQLDSSEDASRALDIGVSSVVSGGASLFFALGSIAGPLVLPLVDSLSGSLPFAFFFPGCVGLLVGFIAIFTFR